MDIPMSISKNSFHRVDPAWREAIRAAGFKPFGVWEIGMAAFFLALIALLWLFTFERIRHEEQAASEAALQRAHNLTRVFEAQTLRTMQAIEVDLALIAHEYKMGKGKVDFARLLAAKLIDKALFQEVVILDEHGKVVQSNNESNQFDLSDREYFAVMKEQQGDAIYVGLPLSGRRSKRWLIPIVRRIEGPRGEFMGLVGYGINPSYFVDFYRREDLQQDGVVTLIGSKDGITRARRARGDDSFGQDASHGRLWEMYTQKDVLVGDFVSAGSLDGVRRFQSFRKVPNYNLLVTVGLSVDEALTVARERGREYRNFAIFGSLALLVLGSTLVAAVWRRRLEREWANLQELQRQAILDNIADVAWFKDTQSRFLAVNKAFVDICKQPMEQIIGKTDHELFPQHIAEAYRADDIDVMSRAGRKVIEEELVHADGTTQTIETFKSRVVSREGTVIGTVGIARDISKRRQDEEARRLSAKAFESIAEGIMVTDENKRIVSINKAFSTITGYQPEDVLGQSPKILQSGRHDAAFYAEMWKDIESAGFWHGEIWDRRKNGEIFPELLSISAVADEAGKTSHYVGVCTDISSLKRYEERLRYQAQHDALTGLPNRFQFQERFNDMLARAERQGAQVAVMMLDLDRFKHVNDSLGHAAGDLLLQQVAERLKSCLRQIDVVARFGGDEFAVLLDQTTVQGAAAIADKLMSSFELPVSLAGHQIFISGSIGISCYPADATDAETLLKNADAAMYRAKAEGRNGFQFFSAEINARALDNLLMSSDLRLALTRDELVLHYQPRVDLSSGRISGAEALVRWQHPKLGLLPPLRFIPIAEEMGLIEAVGEWVLKEACRQVREWQDAGLELERVAVNLAARQFAQSDLCTHVAAVLSEAGLEARYLELELTESMMMQEPERVIKVLTELKRMGATVAIDDFGTGYSSLSYLKRFPIDFLKIDRSFIQGLPGDEEDAAITSAIIAMAKSLGLKLIAEGVETSGQRVFLHNQGCHNGQGYLFSKPVAPQALERMLRADKAASPGSGSGLVG